MAKLVAPKDAKRAPVIVMTTPALRAKVEQLARHEDVSLSEIGRRALEQYLETADA
jgi:predicted transcriptional regulator